MFTAFGGNYFSQSHKMKTMSELAMSSNVQFQILNLENGFIRCTLLVSHSSPLDYDVIG